MPVVPRRLFLASPLAFAQFGASEGRAAPGFPTQEPDLVREMVAVAHNNVARVKELVGQRPTLAKAAWDGGYGDWETALGAASHVGNREIALLLLANGAHPTMFSAAMLGDLDVVKAFVTASPGVQRTRGPHSITLLRHALAGGAQAKAVADYLQTIGGADDAIAQQPLSAEDSGKLAGSYTFGSGANDRLDVTLVKTQLAIARTGGAARGLFHLGSWAFCPVGAEQVRIRFTESAEGMTVAVHDPGVVLTARKSH